MKPSPQGIEVIIICLIFTALATVLLGLRLLARSYTKLKLGRDDALMVLSWVGRLSGRLNRRSRYLFDSPLIITCRICPLI